MIVIIYKQNEKPASQIKVRRMGKKEKGGGEGAFGRAGKLKWDSSGQQAGQYKESNNNHIIRHENLDLNNCKVLIPNPLLREWMYTFKAPKHRLELVKC